MALLLVLGVSSTPEADERDDTINSVISINPLGSFFGLYQASFESELSEWLTLFVHGHYANPQHGLFSAIGGISSTDGTQIDGDFGIGFYPLADPPMGLFIRGLVRLGRWWNAVLYEENDEFILQEISGTAIGLSAQVGFRFVWKHFSFAPVVGLRYGLSVDDVRGLVGSCNTDLRGLNLADIPKPPGPLCSLGGYPVTGFSSVIRMEFGIAF